VTGIALQRGVETKKKIVDLKIKMSKKEKKETGIISLGLRKNGNLGLRKNGNAESGAPFIPKKKIKKNIFLSNLAVSGEKSSMALAIFSVVSQPASVPLQVQALDFVNTVLRSCKHNKGTEQGDVFHFSFL